MANSATPKTPVSLAPGAAMADEVQSDPTAVTRLDQPSASDAPASPAAPVQVTPEAAERPAAPAGKPPRTSARKARSASAETASKPRPAAKSSAKAADAGRRPAGSKPTEKAAAKAAAALGAVAKAAGAPVRTDVTRPAATLTLAEAGRSAADLGATAVRAGSKLADAMAAPAREMGRAPSSEPARLPGTPEFAGLTAETMITGTLAMTRAVTAVQAKLLDHACEELKATLGEAETLVRSDSVSDAIKLQARAFRRAFESYSAHLTELARTARTAMRQP